MQQPSQSVCEITSKGVNPEYSKSIASDGKAICTRVTILNLYTLVLAARALPRVSTRSHFHVVKSESYPSAASVTELDRDVDKNPGATLDPSTNKWAFEPTAYPDTVFISFAAPP